MLDFTRQGGFHMHLLFKIFFVFDDVVQSWSSESMLQIPCLLLINVLRVEVSSEL